MHPLNLDTYTLTVFGNVTSTVYSPTTDELNIIYSVAMQQEKDLSNTILYCGSDIVATNYGKDFPQVFTMYDCAGEDVWINKTGNDEAHVIVQMLQEPPDYYGLGTSTLGISADGALNGFFLLIIILFGLIFFLSKAIGSVNVHREYTGNNTIEGKEHIKY